MSRIARRRCLTVVLLGVYIAVLCGCARRRDKEIWSEAMTEARSCVELVRQHRYQEALPHAKEALRLIGEAKGTDDPSYATALSNLAQVHEGLGEYAEVESNYRQALAIMEDSSGENAPNYATYLSNFGLFCQNRGEYERAEGLYCQALEIRRKTLERGMKTMPPA